MTEAVSTSETSVSFYQTTQRNITEDGHIRLQHRSEAVFLRGGILRFTLLSTQNLRSFAF
jgi:hypothetical protein